MDKPILSQIADDFNARAVAAGWAARCDPTLAFERPELVAVHAAWQRMAAGRPMPSRLEMTPRVLKDWLPHVAFYERVEAEGGKRRYRVRLLGSAYLPLFGELTGCYLDEALPAAALPLWEYVLDTIVAQGAPLRFRTRSEITGKDFMISEYCSGPLTDPAGNANYVMAVGYYSPGNWDEIASGARNASAFT